MAKITIDIPDELVARVVNAVAYQQGYQDEIEQRGANGRDIKVTNPETKAQYTRRMLKRWIKQNLRAYEVNLDQESARIAKETELESVDFTVS